MSKQSIDYFDVLELNELELSYESAMEILRTHLDVLISNFEMVNGGTKSVEHYGHRLKNLAFILIVKIYYKRNFRLK